MINWINSWNTKAKQWDKLGLEVRLFGLTALEFKTDLSDKKIRLVVLNLGFELKVK